jgi:hypothetical protein
LGNVRGMPDQSSAADEHALIQEITLPLDRLPDDAMPLASEADFPIVLRGYDRLAVDAYVKRTSQLVAELQATRSPEAAVRRALERVGEQISGILQRAHDTAEQITAQSRREAEERLELARQEAAEIVVAGEKRAKELDADADRIWSERMRIIEDARALSRELLAISDDAAERFPAADSTIEPEAGIAPVNLDRGPDLDEGFAGPLPVAADEEPEDDATAVLDDPDATRPFGHPPALEDPGATTIMPPRPAGEGESEGAGEGTGPDETLEHPHQPPPSEPPSA